MATIELLLQGYKRFYSKNFLSSENLYSIYTKKGHVPKTLVIGCSDARVDPSILFDTAPGDIFVIRNVANLVPPYFPKPDSYHGTSAALEFAVNNLKVEHIVILGHSGCAGIKALYDDNIEPVGEFSFLESWVGMAKGARERAIEKCKHSEESAYIICEKEGIILSLNNLRSFPWVKDKVSKKQLKIHGWHFNIESGCLEILSENETFKKV